MAGDKGETTFDVWGILAKAMAYLAEGFVDVGERTERLSVMAEQLARLERPTPKSWAAEANALLELSHAVQGVAEIAILGALDAAIRSTGLVDPKDMPTYDDRHRTRGLPSGDVDIPKALRLAKEKGISDTQLAEAIGVAPERVQMMREGFETQLRT